MTGTNRTGTPPGDTDLKDVDLTDLALFSEGFPHGVFARHRRQAPVWWHEPTAHTPGGEGFWSVATYAETLTVLNDPITYSSEKGGSRAYGGTLLEDLPMAGIVLNMMDDPRHARIRRLVSSGLTPRMVRRLEDDLRRRTRLLLDEVGERLNGGQSIDFLTDVAAELPMQMICTLLGVPESDRHELARAVEPLFDLRADGEEVEAGRAWMGEYGTALIGEKRRCPTEDMLSVAVHARLPDVDPPELSDGELYAFFSLLFAAGAETTRNAIAGGLLALIESPAELAALAADPDLLPGAVEEMLRWTTPSPSKRRTATREANLGGHAIRPGEKVLIWEGSANRDELVFDRPDALDIRRDPNPHLGFGHGVHFCLGSNLARLEMRVLFEEWLSAFTDLELAGPVEWTRSNRHTGIRHMPLKAARR